mmetsp:Transcript_59635/g.67831  ORF Transcript_59635/g.67831 Transcript_59635/m.67831 type:complete len:94 (-) Transcript_59635:355-636(-)
MGHQKLNIEGERQWGKYGRSHHYAAILLIVRIFLSVLMDDFVVVCEWSFNEPRMGIGDGSDQDIERDKYGEEKVDYHEHSSNIVIPFVPDVEQ